MKHHLKDEDHNTTVMNMLNHMNGLTNDGNIKGKISKAKQETRFRMMDEINPGWWDKLHTKDAG